MRLRVLDTGLGPARWNVAASAALLAQADESGEPVLRIHRYHASCILGRFQDAETELDLSACRESDIAIARRITGGGAVVMGPGVLAFDLILPGGGAAMQRVTDSAGEALVATLSDLGLAATRPTAGSIALGGLKVSGSAGRLARRAALHQATLLLDLGRAPPLAMLRRRTEGGKPTADPLHRVTDLATALRGALPPTEDLADAFVDRLAAAFALRPERDTMAEDERALADAILADMVGRDDFVLTGDTERRAA